MAGLPTPRKGAHYTITTQKRRLLPRRRTPRRLFSRQSRLARLKATALRWRAACVCFGGAVLLVAGACSLPLLTSSPASADVDAEAKASAEAALLQSGTDELSRRTSFDVPALSQYPELPTGCESVALTNALLSYGFDLTKTTIADTWLPTSDQDFVGAFLGDPRTPEGNSCMAPGLASAASSYLAEQNSSLEAANLTGASFEEVLREVANQHPVIVWCTIGLESPGDCYLAERVDGRLYRLITNSHCIVVSGYDLDSGTVFVSDSLVGQAAYPLETLAARYYALGAQAVVIR